jgi:hypothetical protein
MKLMSRHSLVISLWTARRLDPHANEKDPEVELQALFPATKGSNGLVQLAASWVFADACGADQPGIGIRVRGAIGPPEADAIAAGCANRCRS